MTKVSRMNLMKMILLLLFVAVASSCASDGGSGSRNPDKQSLATPGNTGNTVASDSKTPSPPGETSASSTFLTEAAYGGMAEVELSTAASERAENADVRRFAQMMLTDHGKANGEVRALASEKNVTLPTSLKTEHQAKAQELKGLSGSELDKAYADAMVNDHMKSVDLFSRQAGNAADPDLMAFAAKTLPTLQKHLENIKAIQAKLK